MTIEKPPLLSVRELRTEFGSVSSPVRAVDDVSFDVHAGEVLAIVGESGSGKSVTALSLLRLVSHPGRVVGGQVLFEGRDLLTMSMPELRRVRGSDIAMIFQEPMTSLNPVMTVGRQIAEAVRIHHRVSRRAAMDRAVELLDKVRIPSPRQRVKEFPHQLSGGMRQRAMIAMALACSPKLLIADEPTTALDVTIQAQILDLLRTLQQEEGVAMILITHDFGVVAEHADRALVMYCGRVAEQASIDELFDTPRHPYTRGLLDSVPRLGRSEGDLPTIPGSVAPSSEWPSGCRFQDRCSLVSEACRTARPHLRSFSPTHMAACTNMEIGVSA